MNNFISLIIKGFFLGIANIIPGVSGGTLAITMGIYEDLINAISHFTKKIKKKIMFILPIGIGAVLSILLMSKLISYSLESFPLPTTLFFIGLIVGGIPLLTKKVKGKKIKPFNMAILLLTFSIVMILSLMSEGTTVVDLSNVSFIQMLLLLLVGVVAAATMVIPGISGSFVLMLLGYYKPIIETISNLTDFSLLGHNILVLAPFGIGVLVGIILIAKLIEFLFKKYEVPTYYGIIGFILASVLNLFLGLFAMPTTTPQVLIGLVLFIIAFIVGYRLGDE